jgi:hypothetical protein
VHNQKNKGRLAQVLQAHKQHKQALEHQRHPQNATQVQLRLKTLIRVQVAHTTTFAHRCTQVHSQKNKGRLAQVLQAHKQHKQALEHQRHPQNATQMAMELHTSAEAGVASHCMTLDISCIKQDP